MQRPAKPKDDVERYIADRDARERGFAALVADAGTRLAFGRRMAERRRANGKTQTQVAALMRTSPAIVSRLESGHDVCPKNTAKKTGRAAHDPTQVESVIDFDRLGGAVAAVTAL